MPFLDTLGKQAGRILGDEIVRGALYRMGGGAAVGAIAGGISDSFGGTELGVFGGAFLGAGIGLTSAAGVKGIINAARELGMGAKGIGRIKTYGPMANAFLGRAATGYALGAAIDSTGWSNSLSGWGIAAGATWGALRVNSMLGMAGLKSIDFNGGWSRFKSEFNKKAPIKKHAG